jgi:3-oxoacyl-[acyl-carrier protein] reductase
MDLKGKTALVTGSSRGIGRAIALKFSSLGAGVGVHCVSKIELAQNLCDEINAAGGTAFAFQADISESQKVDQMMDAFIEKFEKIDILVNNAGVVSDCPLAGMQDEIWKRVIDVNLTGTFNMCRAAARHMMARKYGRIINLSSFVASKGGRGQSNYASSKAGIEALTRSLAIELGSRGITVNSICPGAVETDMSRDAIERSRDKIVSIIPLKRLGRPEEVAALAAFLASDEAAYITGESIGVTGGLGLLSW